jgi:hypothetical protein
MHGASRRGAITQLRRGKVLPMADLFRDARLKIERANEHIADVNATIALIVESNTATTEINPESGQQEIKHGIPDFEDRARKLSLIVGDAIHNLRTALDFAWIGILDRKSIPYERDHVGFPVRETLEKFKAAINGTRVQTDCPALFNFLFDEVQPYQGGNNGVIWALHNLDISDKHLLVLGLRPAASIHGAVIRNKDGKLIRASTWLIQDSGPYIIPIDRDMHVEDEGQLAFKMTIEEGGIFKGLEISSLLSSFSQFVHYVVNRFNTI